MTCIGGERVGASPETQVSVMYGPHTEKGGTTIMVYHAQAD